MELDHDLHALLEPMRDMLLQGNDVFHTLRGFPFPNDDPVCTEIQFLMKQNRYGRRLLVRPELARRVTHGLWCQVLHRISRDGEHAVMFHFLRNKPSVVHASRGVTRSRPPSGAARRGQGLAGSVSRSRRGGGLRR
jgi:hypothetical protein